MGLLFSLFKKKDSIPNYNLPELRDQLLLEHIRETGRIGDAVSFWGKIEPGEEYPKDAPVASVVAIPVYDHDGRVIKYDCHILIDEWMHYKYIDVPRDKKNKEEEKKNDDV